MIRVHLSPPMSVTIRNGDDILLDGLSTIDFEELTSEQTPPTKALYPTATSASCMRTVPVFRSMCFAGLILKVG